MLKPQGLSQCFGYQKHNILNGARNIAIIPPKEKYFYHRRPFTPNIVIHGLNSNEKIKTS